MPSGIIVADIMTRNVISIKPDTPLLDCAKKMIKNKIVCLPIVSKDGRLIGLVTQKDILWALVKKPDKDFRKIKAIDVSPRKIEVLNPNVSLQKAIKKLEKRYRLPVISKGKLVGMIAATDVLSIHPGLVSEFEELAQIREESEKLKRLKGRGHKILEGYCEECGNYNFLSKSGKGLVCENCREK